MYQFLDFKNLCKDSVQNELLRWIVSYNSIFYNKWDPYADYIGTTKKYTIL